MQYSFPSVTIGHFTINSGFKLELLLTASKVEIDKTTVLALENSIYKACTEEKTYHKLGIVTPGTFGVTDVDLHSLFFNKIRASGRRLLHSDAGIVLRVLYTQPIVVPETLFIGMEPITLPDGRKIMFCLDTLPATADVCKLIIRSEVVTPTIEWPAKTKFVVWEK